MISTFPALLHAFPKPFRPKNLSRNDPHPPTSPNKDEQRLHPGAMKKRTTETVANPVAPAAPAIPRIQKIQKDLTMDDLPDAVVPLVVVVVVVAPLALVDLVVPVVPVVPAVPVETAPHPEPALTDDPASEK